MNIYITLDYELFFGSKTGSPERCMVEPTQRLSEIVAPYGVKFTLFVDSGYLLALKRQKSDYKNLQRDYDLIAGQLAELSESGHGVELHVHPHWEDSFYNGESWEMNTERYKLASFTASEILEIVQKHADILKEITGAAPRAYRAGGWSAQPFEPIGKALETRGILTDSSVFPGGYYASEHQQFDFRSVPTYTTEYRFSNDLTVPVKDGRFTEIPISACKMPPGFYWKLAATKFLGGGQHSAYGDGQPIRLSKGYIDKLTRTSIDVVSMDGYKSGFMKRAFGRYVKHTSNQGNFVILGHPKAFTSYSLRKFQNFLEDTADSHQYRTFQ